MARGKGRLRRVELGDERPLGDPFPFAPRPVEPRDTFAKGNISVASSAAQAVSAAQRARPPRPRPRPPPGSARPRCARAPPRSAAAHSAAERALAPFLGAAFLGAADGPEVALLLDGNDLSSEEAVHLALAAALGVPASRLVVIAHE